MVRTVRYVVTHTPTTLQVECKLYLKSGMQSKNKFDTATYYELQCWVCECSRKVDVDKKEEHQSPLQTSRGI